jgi:small subunit ribosomal protein S7
MELRKNNHFLYNSVLIKKFIRELAKKGKVQKIAKAFFLCLQALKFKFYLNTFTIFLFLLNEIKPYVILKTLRLGSVSYQVPVPLPFRKQYFKALKLLVGAIQGSKFKESLRK